jgi:hypothetical protein
MLFLRRPLLTVFKNFLGGAKRADITLDINKTIFDFLVFLFLFHTSPGTSLPNHVILERLINEKRMKLAMYVPRM